jgi:hypothetical protein
MPGIEALQKQAAEIDAVAADGQVEFAARLRQIMTDAGERDPEMFAEEFLQIGVDPDEWIAVEIDEAFEIPGEARDQEWTEGITAIMCAAWKQAWIETQAEPLLDMARRHIGARADMFKGINIQALIAAERKAAKRGAE